MPQAPQQEELPAGQPMGCTRHYSHMVPAGQTMGCRQHNSHMVPDWQLCASKLLSRLGMQAPAQQRESAPADPDSDFDEPAPSVPQASSAAQHVAAGSGARSAHSKGKQPAAPAAEDSIAVRRTSRGAAQRARQRFQPEQLRGGGPGPDPFSRPRSPAQVSPVHALKACCVESSPGTRCCSAHFQSACAGPCCWIA